MAHMTLNEETMALMEQWKKAKDAETQWQTYRRSLEDQITAANGGYTSVLETLTTGTTLTKTLKLPEVQVQVGFDLEFGQPEVVEFLSSYPHLHSVIFRPEYKLVSSRAALTAMAGSGEIATALSSVVSRKAKRPSYSLVKGV